MTNIIMVGCNGKMGQVIANLLENDDNAKIVAGVDALDVQKNDFKVYKKISDCDVKADAIIDFSAVACLDDVLDYAVSNNVPLVECTTGFDEEAIEKINQASKKVAILRSANMSLGINTLFKVLSNISALLADAGYDIEIVEKHHNQKLDAPSGTALALADVINDTLNNEYEYKFDRSQDRVKRPKKEIGISALRGGTIVGEHEIVFAGTDEVIELKHTAYSKAIFAKGAIAAAKYLKGKDAGMYDMSNVIG